MTHFAFRNEKGQFFLGYGRDGQEGWSKETMKLFPMTVDPWMILKRHACLLEAIEVVTFNLAETSVKTIGIQLTEKEMASGNES